MTYETVFWFWPFGKILLFYIKETNLGIFLKFLELPTSEWREFKPIRLFKYFCHVRKANLSTCFYVYVLNYSSFIAAQTVGLSKPILIVRCIWGRQNFLIIDIEGCAIKSLLHFWFDLSFPQTPDSLLIRKL